MSKIPKEIPKPLPQGKYTAKIVFLPEEKSVYAEITKGKLKGKRLYLGPTDWYFPKEKEK